MQESSVLIHKLGAIPESVAGGLSPIKGVIVRDHCSVKVPARINLMCFDIHSLSQFYGSGDYRAGELTIALDKMTEVEIKVKERYCDEAVIDALEENGRTDLVKHAALIACHYLRLKPSLQITVKSHRFKHSGLGSSNAIVTAVVTAVNHLCSPNLNSRQCTLIACRHHAEESDIQGNVIHVQANGAIPVLSYYGGGMQVMIGKSHSLYRHEVSRNGYEAVIAMPMFYFPRSAENLMSIEAKAFNEMDKNRQQHAQTIAFRVLHELLPAVIEGNYSKIGEIIDYYRFQTGSLKVDSLLWPGLEDLFLDLRAMRNPNTPIISTSSCGPLIFALTRERNIVEEKFVSKGLQVIEASIWNAGCIIK